LVSVFICCQIFYDLLLKSAFEWIFNVMQLILVNIKWHNKWKYLIQKYARDTRFELFRGDYCSCTMFSWWKNIYHIFRVYHIRIIATTKNWFTRHETDVFLNNHCQECVRAYLSIHENSIWNTAVPLLSYSCMFQVEICS
jgi:hypothetical protein